MTNGRDREDSNGGGGGGGYHRVQAERDLESNWEVDLAHKLEDYLLKICSGEIPDESDDHVAVNFAEGLCSNFARTVFFLIFFQKSDFCFFFLFDMILKI